MDPTMLAQLFSQGGGFGQQALTGAGVGGPTVLPGIPQQDAQAAQMTAPNPALSQQLGQIGQMGQQPQGGGMPGHDGHGGNEGGGGGGLGSILAGLGGGLAGAPLLGLLSKTLGGGQTGQGIATGLAGGILPGLGSLLGGH